MYAWVRVGVSRSGASAVVYSAHCCCDDVLFCSGSFCGSNELPLLRLSLVSVR